MAIAAQHLLTECFLQRYDVKWVVCIFHQLTSLIAWFRILIVDFDVHHGQGTQRTFYEDDR